MRARIAERLKESQNSAASLTTFNEVDMSALMKLRSKYKEDVLEKHSVKFGFMSPFIKAASVALKEIPAVNARIEGDNIVYQDYTDISVAVATPKGLVTPVLRNTDKMGMIEIEKELARMSKKVYNNSFNFRREMDSWQLKTWPGVRLRFQMGEYLDLCMELQLLTNLSLRFWECMLLKIDQWLWMERLKSDQ
jgi:hypothetical protein